MKLVLFGSQAEEDEEHFDIHIDKHKCYTAACNTC